MVIFPVPTGGEVHDVVILDLFDPELCVTDPCIYVEIVYNTTPKTSLAGKPLLSIKIEDLANKSTSACDCPQIQYTNYRLQQTVM